MSMGLIRWYTPDANFKRTANNHLHGHFPNKTEQIWQSTQKWQSQLAPGRPRHSSSVNLMMQYSEWVCALYRALQEQGINHTEACTIAEEIMLEIYKPVPAAMFKLSRLRSANLKTRVKWLLGIITRFFFTSPFSHQHLPYNNGVAFDVTVCPIADYFKKQGVPELTTYAACNLDYCAARELGVELIRSQTIANGAEHCDFRWRFLNSESAPMM